MKTSRSILVAIALLLATPMMQAQEIFDAVKKNDVAKVKDLIGMDPQQIQAKSQQGDSLLNGVYRKILMHGFEVVRIETFLRLDYLCVLRVRAPGSGIID